MVTRILTALVGAPLLLLFSWLGGGYLLAVVALLILLIQNELIRMLKKLEPHRGLVFAGGLILVGGAYLNPVHFPGAALAGILLLYLGSVVVLYPRFSLTASAGTLVAALYPGLLLYVFLLRELGGWQWLLLVLLVTWAFDTFGYLTGKLIGRTKMTPNLSPGKTFEGLAGGLLAAVGVGVGAGVFLTEAPIALLITLAVVLGAAAQMGDLFASAVKRFAGVKDTGRLLPGHGGVLDRFDSLLFTAPIATIFIYWLM